MLKNILVFSSLGRMKHDIQYQLILPDLTANERAILAAVRRKVPGTLEEEMRDAALRLEYSYEHLLRLNLDYEFGGMACLSAAVPEPDGYTVVRCLEWGAPDEVKGHARWVPLTRAKGKALVRQIPGYVGALSGICETDEGVEHVAQNLSPDAYDTVSRSPHAIPSSWLIRAALGSGKGLVEYLLNGPPVVRQAFAVVTRADWVGTVLLNPDGDHSIHSEAFWPTEYAISNEWDQDEYALDNLPIFSAETADWPEEGEERTLQFEEAPEWLQGEMLIDSYVDRRLTGGELCVS
jgi:hypothetical protein